MRGITNFCLKNKLAVWILIIIVVASGLYSGLRMKMETIPNISMPLVSITTVYPGAPPDEVANDVTVPLENQLRNLTGVKIVSSSSTQNASSIQIEFNYGTDMNKAENDVKTAIGKFNLPEGANDPQVSRMSFNAFPVMALSVSSKSQSLPELTDRVEKDIVPSIEGIEGVSKVQISGQQVQEVDLNFNDKKLAQYGLTKDTVENLIKGSAISVPLGLFQFDTTQKMVVIDGNITTLDGLKNLVIPVMGRTAGAPGQMGQSGQTGPVGQAGQAQGTPGQGTMAPSQANTKVPANMSGLPTVKLSDIATVNLVGKAESISRTNGQQSIGIQVVKASDANTVEVVNKVKDKMKELQKKYKDMVVVTTFDQGQPIQESVDTMLSKAIFGALFAALIILLFLRNIRTTIISVISIPLSILIAILILNKMGITLNIMTLGAMTVAIGRVIDDSIVVIENIYRRMSLSSETLKGKVLIREATKEMFIPILSSTIVTVAVFLPLGLVQGTVGELFLPFALTIVFSLAASLLIAITVVPMLTHTFFKKGLRKRTDHVKRPGRLASFYKRVLNWSLNHKLVTFGLAILLLIGSLFLVPLIGASFLPSDEQKMVVATFNPAPGETEKQVEKTAQKAEDYFNHRKGVTTIQYTVGGSNPMNPAASSQGLFYVNYDKDTPNFSHEQDTVIKDLQKQTDKGEWGTIDMSSTGGDNFEMYVYGDTQKDIQSAAQKITDTMKKDSSFKNVDSSLSRAYDQYTLVADQAKLSQYGLTAGQIGMSLTSVGQAPVLTTIQKDGKKINVYVQVDKKTYNNVDDLKNTEVQSPLGKKITLGSVMNVKKGKAPETITRRDGELYASVTAKITTKDVGAASGNLQKKIDKMNFPSGVSTELGGVTQQMNDSFTQLGLAMLAAIAIVYFVLVITFGNGLAPLAILFSLPFTVIGGFLGLYISGETLSISAMIGALMLIGIVVANAIVLIDRVTRKEKEGLSTREALLEAAGTRLRPILMTAIATIGALIPLAIGVEGGGLISRGLGVTVIGGLASSTLLTLLIAPIVYEFLMKFRRKGRRATDAEVDM